MRCPNCGNENPNDYTFCDECGAKLTPQVGEATATDTAQEAAYSAVEAAAGPPLEAVSAPLISSPLETVSAPLVSAPLEAEAAGIETGEASQVAVIEASVPASTEAGICPNCGASTVPGEAYCNECGVELATAAAGGSVHPSGPMEPYMEAGDSGAASGDLGLVPVTEDTMPSDMQSAPMSGTDPGEAAMPSAEAEQPSMPGVMPIVEAGEAVVMPEFAPEPASAQAATTGASDAGAWAMSALKQLEDAQQAMSKGDWVTYGGHMSGLKAFLESLSQGATPAMGSIGTTYGTSSPQPAEAAAAPAAEAGVTGAAPVPVAYQGTAMARLVVISTGAEMPLPQQEEITVGREDPSSGIFPDVDLTPYGGEDGGVSRRHARLLHIGGEYFVEDLQSTNYTKLDGQRLPARVREKLEDGARLDFGRIAMIFRKS